MFIHVVTVNNNIKASITWNTLWKSAIFSQVIEYSAMLKAIIWSSKYEWQEYTVDITTQLHDNVMKYVYTALNKDITILNWLVKLVNNMPMINSFCAVPSLHWSGGCLTNVLQALQDILLKFVYCRNHTSYENFKMKLCFGHKYKISTWNSHHKWDFWHCILSRDYFGELTNH